MTAEILLFIILLAGNWIYLIVSDLEFRKRQKELKARLEVLEQGGVALLPPKLETKD